MSDPSAAPDDTFASQARAAGKRFIPGRVLRVTAVARSASAVLVLMVASIISATAAVIGLTGWVSVIAAITAVVSGFSLLQANLIVPVRTRMAEDATAQILSGYEELLAAGDKQYLKEGTCFQIARGRWMTVAHLVHDEQRPLPAMVKVGDQWHDAQITSSNHERGLTVLTTAAGEPGIAKITRSLPAPGTAIEVVGWTSADQGQPTRVTLRYTVQAPVRETSIMLTGPAPPRGFAGAAAIEVSTGRVVGILVSYRQHKQSSYRPGTLDVIDVMPLSRLFAGFG